MYLIVGLGNPEEEYSRTRHNMGFDAINKISIDNHILVSKEKFNSIYGIGNIEKEKVILLKPQTYMNLSGQAVKKFKDFFKVENHHIIVIYDDIDLEPGNIRVRAKGNPGTHNGMKSVTHELNSIDFARVRIGVGKPEYKDDLTNYILSHINDDDYKKLEKGIECASKATIDIVKNGINFAMNQYN